MKTENARKEYGKIIKVIEIEGIPKERISVIHQDLEKDSHNEVCGIFGKGLITIIFKPS